jgi:hypothetical protein
MRAFQAIVLVPVCLILVCFMITVAGCEVFAAEEAHAREAKLEGHIAEPESINHPRHPTV